MNIGQLYKILLGRIWVIAVTVILAVSFTYIFNKGKQELLRARATLLIDFQQPTTDTTLPAMLQEGYLATQAEIISSQRVASKVIENLNLQQDLKYYKNLLAVNNQLEIYIYLLIYKFKQYIAQFTTQEPETVIAESPEYYEQELINTILSRLRVTPRDNTRLIDINYLSSDGDFSIDMANAFADAYVQVDLGFKTSSAGRNATWMSDQIAELRDKLEIAQNRLINYEKQTGILASGFSNDNRENIELRHLAEITSELAKAQAEADFQENKLNQMTMLKSQGGDLNTIPEVMSNPLIQNIKIELRQKEAELVELSTGIGKNHPNYQSVLLQIQNLRNELSNEVENINVLISNQAVLARAKVDALLKAQTSQKEKLLIGRDTSSDLPALVREIENAQRNYESALQRYEQYYIDSQINQTNVAVLSYAKTSIRSRIPKMARSIILAIICGLILGCGVAIVLEFRRPLIHDKKDVARIDVLYLGKINAG